MLARHRQLFTTGLFFLDGAILFASWVAAYLLRFQWLGLSSPRGVPPLSLYLWFGAVLTPIALLVLRTFRIYRSTRTARLGQELFALAQGMAIITAIAGLASFFARGELSRSVLLLFGALATVMLLASRIAVRLVLRVTRRRGRNLRHVLVVGAGELARRVVQKIGEHPDYGLVVQGLVAPGAAAVGTTLEGVPVLGTVAELPAIVERTHVDLVYLALARSEWEVEDEALQWLSDSTATVRLVPDLARAFTLNASVEDFDGMPVVLVTESPGQGWNAVLKRAFDLVCSGLGLVVLSPVLLAIAAWIRLDSPGPVFFAQDRVGLNGLRFPMLKFRTMRVGADDGELPAWSTPGDPRRTRAGAVLRALSLDELPQLWNVLLGQMSLVGPRPEQPYYVDRFRASVPRYMLRHHVKAGITGWAQINGLRGDTPLDRRIEYDLYYIRNWSLGFDLKILWLTVMRVFRDASAQ
jgi:Undecaprenyl-phosphate glucose phosphotransferase